MSKLDWIVSQALNGQEINEVLFEKRGEYEEQLRCAKERVKKSCDDLIADQHALSSGTPELGVASIDIDGQLSQAESELNDAAKALHQAENAEAAFKPRHGLTREASDVFVPAGVLLLLIVMFGEGGINTSFFYNAHMVAGPFAALLLSLLIAFANVSVSASAGYFIGRWLHYGQNAADADASELKSARLRARGLLVGFIGAIGWFHLTVGLVRAQETLEITHSPEHYLALATVPEALFLVLIGVCMSALAFYKGMNAFDDPYPGYGARHRAVVAKREALRETYEAQAEALSEPFDAALDDAKKFAKTRERVVTRFNKKVRRCIDDYRALERTVAKAENALATEIALMAGHHRAARGVKAKTTRTTLGHLIDFQPYLSIELPAFLHAPDFAAVSVPIIEAKAEALSRLAQTYERILHSKNGEVS